ncbi:hypothetical protein ABS751_09490 [Bacillus subtilis]|uniref:Class I SAM-dependent methyltransferase n=1 Tax=Bacillus halotolerans TaxID=260554 RepID=A0ABY7I2B5_9BACI|nr:MULTISPECIES: hypothetical protein [Bacillus]QQF64407.1 hypothetical protein I9X38_09200 [Bacillus mojavensis]BDG78967.1 hypothetical protein BSF_06960 [Bacillus subtilis]KUP31805.1 hypothetical protein AU385_13550 [Bacillus halotolerans]MBL4967536.1 hypothetical protein [Bacillus halotolerans]MBL4971605.1 hypothetical protein [Bacillus halotolerans]
MKRLQLFEFMDFEWFPKFLRDLITDVLNSMLKKGSPYDDIIPVIKKVMKKSDTNQIVDLCSGGGGPWLGMIDTLQKEDESVKLTLTDKFPNKEAIERITKDCNNKLVYIPESVDAAEVPADLKGMRTIFGGFHHMNSSDAKAIFKNAAEKRQGIVVGESMLMPPGFAWTILPILILLSPLFLIFYWIQFAKVIRGDIQTIFARLIFTYLIPIAPLVMMFDGFVSIVRIYTKKDLEEIVHSIEAEGYTWEVNMVQTKKNQPPIVYAAGYPNQNELLKEEGN